MKDSITLIFIWVAVMFCILACAEVVAESETFDLNPVSLELPIEPEPAPAPEDEVSPEPVPGFVPLSCELPEGLQEYTYTLCMENDLNFSLVMALMYCESGFDATLISDTDDYGLMQINTVNHDHLSERLGMTDPLDPYQNIAAGVYMLSGIMQKYSNPTKALMVYNMGESGAARRWDQGVFETEYTNKVLGQAQEYQNMIDK